MKKVLVIEDDLALRQAINLKLVNSGYEVQEARNGVLGYEAIVEDSPDVILLDIEMPRMNGIEVLKKMSKNLIETKNVIMLTNDDNSEHLADAMELGVTSYLIKKDQSVDRIIEEIDNLTK